MEQEIIERAITATGAILNRHGLGYEQMKILHRSNNLVLRPHPLPIVAKVATGLDFQGRDPSLALAVATHLRALNVPCVAPAAILPVQVYGEAGFQATFWEYFEGESIEAPDRNQVLDLVLRLHQGLSSFHHDGLPRLETKFDDCIRRLEQASVPMPGLPASDRTFLAGALKELECRLENSSSVRSIIHGDCHPRNLLWNKQGTAKWIDFEAVCFGPIAWDYVFHFDEKDDIREAHGDVTEILAAIMHACVATWCREKVERTSQDQEAAEYHLAELKRKLARASR